MSYIENQQFEALNFNEEPLAKANYEDCRFLNCDLSSADLADVKFAACSFENCDLSMANIENTAFQEVSFKNCKMLGLRFEEVNEFLFSVSFLGCQLNFSSFYQRTLANTQFEDCSLQEVDFVEANLQGTILKKCDLQGAMFERTNLEQADLSTSFNFNIDPAINQIHAAKFSAIELIGLLRKYDIEVVL